MDDSYLSWDNFDKIQKYISNLLNINCKWSPIEGTMVDTNEFMYKSDKYNIFISCRKNNSFGFGINKGELMEIIINETIPYDNYKEYIFETLQPIFNLSSQESNPEGSKQFK